MGKEEYWNRFTNSGNVYDYLAYKVADRLKKDSSMMQVGVDTNGAVNCCDRNNFACSAYR